MFGYPSVSFGNNWEHVVLPSIRGGGADSNADAIGFWAFDVSGGEPYIQGAKDYLYKAIGWARSSGVKVLVSFLVFFSFLGGSQRFLFHLLEKMNMEN